MRKLIFIFILSGFFLNGYADSLNRALCSKNELLNNGNVNDPKDIKYHCVNNDWNNTNDVQVFNCCRSSEGPSVWWNYSDKVNPEARGQCDSASDCDIEHSTVANSGQSLQDFCVNQQTQHKHKKGTGETSIPFHHYPCK